jgi:hypothetical protein
MLWIGGQITTGAIMKGLFIASMVNMLVPLIIASFFLKGNVVPPDNIENGAATTSQFEIP